MTNFSARDRYLLEEANQWWRQARAVRSSSLYYSDCVADIASLKNNPADCNNLVVGWLRERCVSKLAVKNNNVDACDFIPNEMVKSDCVLKAGDPNV